ncbi:MAG: hypothetical protein COW40_11130, partial [Cytophagales bacterium CG17_big_fil_post_rev_8_21_14_2_50_40_13]
MRLQKIHFFAFTVLFGCSKTEVNDAIIKDLDLLPNQALIIINNSTDSPISIDLLDSGWNQSIDGWLTSYKEIDTLALKLNRSTRISIHSLVRFQETRFVSPGDTLTVNLSSSVMQVESTDRLNAQKLIKERSETLLETDSLYNLFIRADSSMAMRGSNDLSLFLSIPVFGDKSLVKSNPALLDELVNRLIDQLEMIPASLTEINNPELEAIQSLKYEINREEAFIRLRLLTSQLNRPEILDKIFSSNLYKTDEFIKGPFAYGYLVFFIKNYVLQGMEDRSRNQAYVDYKLAYDKLPNTLEGELLKTAQEICLEKMLEYGESQIIVGKYLNKFLAEHKDSAFVESFENRFLLAYKEQIKATVDLVLMSNSGAMLSLSELVKEATDSTQLFYIDFWASW